MLVSVSLGVKSLHGRPSVMIQQEPNRDARASLFVLVCVILFVAFFEVGLGAIPWAIGGEIFPVESRGAAMALAAAVNWV